MANKPIHLPLIVAAPTFTADNPALTGGGVPQTITVQLTTQCVQRSLSETLYGWRAARIG